MKLESWHSPEEKQRWKIVRTDSYIDVVPPGEIIIADEVTGEYMIQVNGEQKTMSLGPSAFASEQKRHPAGTSTSTNVRPDEAEVHAVSMACRTTVVSQR